MCVSSPPLNSTSQNDDYILLASDSTQFDRERDSHHSSLSVVCDPCRDSQWLQSSLLSSVTNFPSLVVPLFALFSIDQHTARTASHSGKANHSPSLALLWSHPAAILPSKPLHPPLSPFHPTSHSSVSSFQKTGLRSDLSLHHLAYSQR